MAALPFAALIKEGRNGVAKLLGGLVLGLPITAAQGLIVAHATTLSLAAEPERWVVAWFLTGLFFSVPIATIRGDSRYRWLGIATADLAYIVGFFLPEAVLDFLRPVGQLLAMA